MLKVQSAFGAVVNYLGVARCGKDSPKVYTHLTSWQQSLLLFWVLYGHSRYGVFQFYKEVDYLLLNTDIWKDLKDRLRCFWDDDLLDLVSEMENIYHGYFKTNSFTTPADDSNFQQTITILNKKINKIVPDSIKKVGKYIRNNPDDFVHFVE